MDFAQATFFDVEADRAGRVMVVAGVRGDQEFRIDVARLSTEQAARALRDALGEGPLGGHNAVDHDVPKLQAAPLSLDLSGREVLDTLVLFMLAEPGRASHALDKPARSAGAVPDPLADARAARALALDCMRTLGQLDPDLARFHAALLATGGHPAIARLLGGGLDAARPGSGSVLADMARRLPEALLSKLCRVRLPALIESVSLGAANEHLSLALALRFVELHGEGGRLAHPPGPKLSALPRFTELLTRLLGPLCPDPVCAHRSRCSVHRPFAREILQKNFELAAFRPHQEEVVHAVLDGQNPFVVLPTGGGKSLCYQLPAVHGAERLCALSVVISPLQALMADQVQALSERYPGACYVNSTLLLGDRQRQLAGLRSGAYNVLYIGPEQLRNPSMLRLLRARPPFLWVIDEAHCISQWGHSFRTDYTYLPRAIRELHEGRSRPLLGLFTATATPEVERDVAAQFGRLGVELRSMSFGAARDNLAYDVIPTASLEHKDRELVSLLSAFEDSSRLVYCATVRAARDVAEMLRERGIDAALYHGKLEPNQKADELARFLGGRSRTVVATSAFGMGIDKPDIRLVVHYELPGSLEDYIQETGRAGRDGAPSRCVLLFAEEDLDTQFFLKTAGRVTARDVRFVFRVLLRRARRLPRDSDGRVALWVAPEELFVDECLEDQLDWTRDVLSHKLKLVLYHLEADGVLERTENRTRVFGVFALEPSLAEARAKLPPQASRSSVRVLEFLYDPDRPERISIFDIAEAAGIEPAAAFRELNALLELRLIGQDLAFEVAFARGVPGSTRDAMAKSFELARALFDSGEDLDERPVLHVRSTALALGRQLARAVRPHEVFALFWALRRLGSLRLEKVGPGSFAVRFEGGVVLARERLRGLMRTSALLVEHVDSQLVGRSGRDLFYALDLDRFIRSHSDLFHTERLDEVVDACLLLHHLGAWHLSDPPVVFETALKVRIDPTKRASDLDLARPRRQHEHQISLVHLMREYAVLPAATRGDYLRDYFSLERDAFVERYFRGRKRRLGRPITERAEAKLLGGLTEAQRRAVTSEARALVVIAGPGSGKTHTVVRRIAHMVYARQIRPDEILALAFNRSAVRELAARLEHVLGSRGRLITVETFHALALRLAGGELDEEKLDRDARLTRSITRAAELLEGSTDADPALDPEELRRRLLGPIRHVLVDEYQDLDPDQFRMLSALVGLDRQKASSERTERSIFVVGDDDQAIYGFRQASLEFLQRFAEDFSAERICLVENFRSSAPIVNACSRFIRNNPERIKLGTDEQLRPAPGAPGGDEKSARRFLCGSQEQAAAHAAYSVLRSSGEDTGSIAVLARHWAELDPVRAELEAAGIPFTLHDRDQHRPLHRRYPTDRLLRELWKQQVRIDGRAVDYVERLLLAWGRSPLEPPLAAVLELARDLDASRALRSKAGAELPDLRETSSHELASAVLAAARDGAFEEGRSFAGAPHARAARGEAATRVHLATFHAAKGLEFDKVIVLPTRLDPRSDAAAERRTYYVAMTRARRELSLATLGQRDELAAEVPVPLVDVSRFARLVAPRVGYLDCTPSDVQITSPELARAQRSIARLREGDPLELDTSGPRARWTAGGELVAVMSQAGEQALRRLRARCPGPLVGFVHEVFVHFLDKPNLTDKPPRRTLVVLPAIRAGERSALPGLVRATPGDARQAAPSEERMRTGRRP